MEELTDPVFAARDGRWFRDEEGALAATDCGEDGGGVALGDEAASATSWLRKKSSVEVDGGKGGKTDL